VAVDDTGTREWLSHAKSSTLQVTCRRCPTAGVEGVGITVMVGAAGAARDLGRKQGQERVADVWAKVTQVNGNRLTGWVLCVRSVRKNKVLDFSFNLFHK
jgi:hypothetical protein